MITFLNFIAVIWCTAVGLFFLFKIVKGYKNSILFIYFVFYIFFVFPIILDYIYGIPYYFDKTGFTESVNDLTSNLIYPLYVCLIPLIWLVTAKIGKNKKEYKITGNSLLNFISKFKFILYILLILPIILVLNSPNPSLYLEYGAIVKNHYLFSVDSYEYHKYVHMTSILSVISAVGLFLLNRRISDMLFLVFLLPPIFFSIWVQGKRGIVAILVVLLLFAILYKWNLKGFKLVLISSISVFTLLSFSTIYQNTVRTEVISNNTDEYSYTQNRIDFGRDDVTKLVIYSELNGEYNILQFRGQTLIYYFTMFVPREFWNDKPWPYPVYLTSAVYDYRYPVEYIGFTITTSILDEAIANFSWLGMIIGPLLLTVISRLGDSSDNIIVNTLTILVGSLFLVLPMNSFFPIFYLWLGLIFYEKLFKKSISVVL